MVSRYAFADTNSVVTHPLPDRYVSIISLSLYFFNLLPIPFLDGSQVLHAALDYFEPPSGEEYDVETLTRTTVGWGRRSMIEQGMSGLAIGLSGLMLFETVLVQIVL